jgi:hypothetical protein
MKISYRMNGRCRYLKLLNYHNRSRYRSRYRNRMLL